MTNEEVREAALRSAGLIAAGLDSEEPKRPELALGALLAGYASGIAGFAIHHAVCQTIVRELGAPHAQTNAVMLPHFVRFMEPRAPEALEDLGNAMNVGDSPASVTAKVSELAARAGVTRLGELGVQQSALDQVVGAAMQHPALGNTPEPPDPSELRVVLEAAL
jgi:alcohol dehydrogenase class IV